MAVATASAEPFLQARGLSVRYGQVVALDGVDLDVHAGEILALAGENGAGKSSLVRCIAGDRSPDSGTVTLHGRRLKPDPRDASRQGLAVVWQDLALCDNLDIASNVLLGREARRLMFSETRFHARAAALLDDLGIALPSTGTLVAALSGGQRQLVAVARAMRDRPSLLILDEPTASLGVSESARVEELAGSLPAQGTAVLIVSHDVEQMFRLADRIVIMRRGRVVAEIDPDESHPDEVAGLLSGQGVDLSARRQLTRLHSLADQLASAEPSSSLTLIMSALGAAIGTNQLCVHVTEGQSLRLAGALGFSARLAAALSSVVIGPAGGQIGRAAASGEPVLSRDVKSDPAWGRLRVEARQAAVASSWSVPFTGASGDSGVVTVMGPEPGEPTRDDLELMALYAGFAASALERDRLVGEVTSRNRVLETIRDVLQVLAGPAPFESGLRAALHALLRGLAASDVALVTASAEQPLHVRAWAARTERPRTEGQSEEPPAALLDAARLGMQGAPVAAARVGKVASGPDGEWIVAAFPAPGGLASLVTHWAAGSPVAGPDRQPLIDDAANSLRLALEREASEKAQRETMALRSSQELQRQFLSWLSHELRTPLTAIRGYASSLMQPDVDWDGTSQKRFLERISAESARLGRLVDDLLDFSAIDAGILRLHPDWCDLALVLEAARSCLPPPAAEQVTVTSPENVVVWADHDRLEQIFVNLLDNAVRHNPAGTAVEVDVSLRPPGQVTVSVSDDGVGMAADAASGRLGVRPDRRSRTAGAGLGLSIARGIAEAHGGRLDIRTGSPGPGTSCVVQLPMALGAPADGGPDAERVTAR
jgi:signal transduction histidine kinase/ABC-type multidrug transport system ATPase subunit